MPAESLRMTVGAPGTIGSLDPRTGDVKEFALPEIKKGSPTGSLSLRADADENLWLGMMYQGAIARFDRKTEKLQVWNVPDTRNPNGTQINMTSPLNAKVDGKATALPTTCKMERPK